MIEMARFLIFLTFIVLLLPISGFAQAQWSPNYHFFLPFSVIYRPILNLTLTLEPLRGPAIQFDPIELEPQTLPFPTHLIFHLPDTIETVIGTRGEDFTPVLRPIVTFEPSGVVGRLSYSIGLPPVVFQKISDVKDESLNLVLPLPARLIVITPEDLLVDAPEHLAEPPTSKEAAPSYRAPVTYKGRRVTMINPVPSQVVVSSDGQKFSIILPDYKKTEELRKISTASLNEKISQLLARF